MLKKYYALCVDDDQSVLSQLAIQLEDHFQEFCEFEYAENAEQAFEIYTELVRQGERVWLIICDQVMPGMQGDELLAKIQQEEDGYHLIKVLLTGQAGLSSTIKALNHAGLNYYIEKPWKKDDLLVILERLKFQYEMSTIINELNLRFASSIDLNETLETVFHNIINVIQVEAGSIFLVDHSSHSLICKICHGATDITGIRVPLGSGIVGHVAETREIDVTADVKHDTRHNPAVDQHSGFVTKSMVSVPLVSKDETLGVIQVVNKKGGKPFSKQDVHLLQALSSGGALAIQNAQYAQRLLQEERIRSELLIAHQIQQGILPEPFAGHPAIHFEAVNEPAKDVGGDFYDYLSVSEQEFAFYIGDVCGKGMPAAIFMASSRSIIKSQALAAPHPISVMPLSNRLIAEDAQHSGLYVTVFYGVYNIDTHRLQFTNAGHTPTLLYRPCERRCSALLNTNFPLGMFEDAGFEDAEIQLEPGDVLILYTDGINEAKNSTGEQFGMERLVRLILEHGHRPPKDLMEHIVNSVQVFAGDQEPTDDLTVMVVQV